MKIIFGSSQDRIAEHAAELVKNNKAKEPMGVPCYSAQVPESCTDCGETYWHRNDPYGWFPHIGCKNGKGHTGF